MQKRDRCSEQQVARRRARFEELARLVPLWPHEIEDTSHAGRARLVAALHRALKAERRRGVSGHWSYDLARHAALLAAWRRERAGLGPAVASVSRNDKGRRPTRRRPRTF